MRHGRHAFTLIELMIAIALGLVLIYTAAAGLRTAAQTVTLSNRLALENEIVRNGFELALDEVDFWHAYDDPTDPGRLGQRGAQGLFASFKDNGVGVLPTPPETSSTVIIDVPQVPPSNDSERGWKPDFSWPVADPRTWWRNNMVERSASDLRFGRYGRYSALSPAATAIPNTVPNTWLANQIDRLQHNLGYYAMADYLPSGTIYGYVGGSDGVTSGGMCQHLGNGGTLRFQNGDGGADFAQSLYRATKNTAFAIYPLTATSHLAAAEAPFTHFLVGQDAVHAEVVRLQATSQSSDPVLELRPATWPSLTVSVARTLAFNRFACVARVHWASPLTGSAAELSFTCFGTSLRGARQQRRPGTGGATGAPGWAVWNCNHLQTSGDPDPTHPNDVNLDNEN